MRRTCSAVLAAVGVAFCAIAPTRADGPEDGPLRVRIESPHGGVVAGPTVTLEATISDPRIRTATMVMNGASYEVPVEGGRVRQTVVAGPGNNRVGIVAQRGRHTARDSVTFRYTGEPIEMMIL